ncbi:unnamed protein product [Medioppia subpectinata]|uniref:Uncharacterized protein n=1 Tax=Medioppia subpectinata TaxID=1979941 RepID=A0A7R9PWN3_9ACAR|nr:unnamed protein product [Medioppia subpectinata]CAG2103925.1 unnamed protein product [Medioppia subpectinata]
MLVNKFTNFIARAIVCLALLIGCIWHIVDISVIYFRYETTVSTVLETAQVIELPAITLCTRVHYVTDWEYLRRRYPNDTALANITDQNKWRYNQYLYNLTLEEQLLNGTIGANRFFDQCEVLTPRALSSPAHYMDCARVAPVVESINEAFKCFTFFSQNVSQLSDNDRYRVDHDVMFRDNDFTLTRSIMHTRYLKDLSIYMHDRREPFVGPTVGQTTYMKINHRHYFQVGYSYKEIYVKQLPPPYWTQCVDYPLLGYRSHKQRVSKCRAKYYRDQFASWHPKMLYNNEYYGKLSFDRTSITSNRTADKQIAADCANRIGRRPDCHSVYYTMNKSFDSEKHNTSKEEHVKFYVYIKMPTNTITRYVHSPRMELSQYMGIIGGVSGLWFGLNILAFYDIGHYETTVSVVLETAQVIELPAITLCTDVNYVTDWEYLRHRYPNNTALANITGTEQNKWAFNSYLYNLTVEEQLLYGTYGASGFLKFCTVLTPRGMSSSYKGYQYISCKQVAPVVESINHRIKCFTVFSQNVSQMADNDRYRVDHDVTFRDNAFSVIYFVLETYALHELTIYMHDRREPFVGPMGGQTTYMDLNHRHYDKFDFSYKELNVEQLPPPYRTQCADYPLLGYRSYKQRVSQCRAEYYRDQFAGWQGDMIYNTEYYGKLSFETNGINGNRTVDKQIADHCAQRVGRRPDCHSVYYTMNVISNHERDNNSNEESFNIQFNIPTNTITRYVHSPRMELSEYMGIIGGVSGLWFGLNILAFYDIGQYLVRKARVLLSNL